MSAARKSPAAPITLDQAREAHAAVCALLSDVPAAGAVGITRLEGGYAVLAYCREGAGESLTVPASVDGVPVIVKPSPAPIVAFAL